MIEKLIKAAEKGIKKELVEWAEKGPDAGDMIVVYDGKAPEAAARNIAMYLAKEKDRGIYLTDADGYAKIAKKFRTNQVIIVGHHDLAKQEMTHVAEEFSEYGMKYGKSDWQYVLRASKKALDSKKEFAGHYDRKMSCSPYQELAKSYGTPARFADRNSTREAQYGLLWMEFVIREFSGKNERKEEQTAPEEGEPPPVQWFCPPDTRPEQERLHEREKIEWLRARGQLEYGIVFCGGGAKGAFELGVWKWLDEHGLADRFTGVSGASVGALNTLLFVQQDYKKAEAVWMGMEDGDLVQQNKELEQYFKHVLLKKGDAAEKLAGFIHGWQKNAGAFSKEKLLSVVRENISVASLENKLAYVSLTVLALKSEAGLYSKYAYLDSRGEDPVEETVRKVLASAALPGAYAPEKVDGDICVDGGVLDNWPAYPLVKAGFREIVVVHLSVQHKDGEDRLEKFNRDLRRRLAPEELEQVRFYHVWPDVSLENLLKINPELTGWRIQAGYEAAQAQLGELLGGNN